MVGATIELHRPLLRPEPKPLNLKKLDTAPLTSFSEYIRFLTLAVDQCKRGEAARAKYYATNARSMECDNPEWLAALLVACPDMPSAARLMEEIG